MQGKQWPNKLTQLLMNFHKEDNPAHLLAYTSEL